MSLYANRFSNDSLWWRTLSKKRALLQSPRLTYSLVLADLRHPSTLTQIKHYLAHKHAPTALSRLGSRWLIGMCIVEPMSCWWSMPDLATATDALVAALRERWNVHGEDMVAFRLWLALEDETRVRAAITDMRAEQEAERVARTSRAEPRMRL